MVAAFRIPAFFRSISNFFFETFELVFVVVMPCHFCMTLRYIPVIFSCPQIGSRGDRSAGYQRPPIISRAVDEVLAEVVSHVVDDFFSSWYSRLAFEADLQAQTMK